MVHGNIQGFPYRHSSIRQEIKPNKNNDSPSEFSDLSEIDDFTQRRKVRNANRN